MEYNSEWTYFSKAVLEYGDRWYTLNIPKNVHIPTPVLEQVGIATKANWHNITIYNQTGEAPYVTLLKNHEYRYVIKTGSYPQIIHEPSKDVTGGTIPCDKFIDANGKTYTDWIPAIRLYYLQN